MSDGRTNNFESARDMIPIEAVQEIVDQRRCYNYRKGCKFQTKWYFCTCCMMLKPSFGSQFFEYHNKLLQEDPDFAFSMTEWQREEFEKWHKYNIKWSDNYPRGATL
jgi:hypothetical protein